MRKEVRNNKLYFDGCNMEDLARRYGTPLYVFSQNEILERFDELKTCFLEKHPQNRVAYAAKAFCCTAMLKLVELQGMCIDVVSGGELFTAMKANFPAERIEFNGNNKSRQELELALEYGVGRIIVDSLQEIDLIEEICREKNVTAKILFRITPGVKADSHDFIVTGKKDSKFGIPLDDEVVLPYAKKAIESKYINFLGLHFHVGSQLFDNSAHLQALEIVLQLAKKLKEAFQFEIKELNLGGGFGITYTDEARKPYAYFLQPMIEMVEKFAESEGINMPALVIEPGRSIVGEAGMTLYTAGAHKDIAGLRNYVSVDGGMTDNIRTALYDAKYKACVANRVESAETKVVTVCGKCCESGDILIRDAVLPFTRPGDIVALYSTGAYGYSMASNYNRNTIPGCCFC